MKKTNKTKQMGEREWLEFAKQHLWLGEHGVCSIVWDDPDAEPRVEVKHSWESLPYVLKLKHGNPEHVRAIYQQVPQLCASAQYHGGFSGKTASVYLDQARVFLREDYCAAEQVLRVRTIRDKRIEGSTNLDGFKFRQNLAWSISLEEKKVTAHPNVPSSFVGLLKQPPIEDVAKKASSLGISMPTMMIKSPYQIPEAKPGSQVKIEQPERSIAWDYAGWAIAGAFFGAMVIGPLLWR